ncbi:conserved hypothetical protein [Theileria orientalis strain Shintoku]|uniref:Ribosomal RNA-processing protein 7 C-terminal domain-containing protein n=1 Tax=Theileria orientalis strain Shintoku TaxID=869250 RepID=J4DP48_THEOR|nr:conserved hypothetical protein [Theileria orientalis strain Shintoku]BAM40084.1 conserved hypothetical protein [Theileria orientalis strain Shintoku]|eukprot:XP_009690385.1 conserved hypothetical protein [Theileria orientalis strain Shintoku]
MGFKGHVINTQVDEGLPFYSQVILTSSSFHKNKESSADGSSNTFLFKSLDPLITTHDMKKLVLHSECLLNFFNIRYNDVEIIEKGSNLYHTRAANKNVEIPRVLTVEYTPSFYSKKGSLIKGRINNTPVNIPNIQKICDEYMSKYDLQEAINKRMKKKIVTDEEGFQLVTAGPLPVKASELPLKKRKK